MFGGKELHSKVNNICLNVNNILINDPHIISEVPNEYFITIGQKLANLLPTLLTLTSPLPMIPYNLQSSYPTSKDEIISFINGLKNGSASGLDIVSVKLIKALKTSIAIPLSSAINECFNQTLVIFLVIKFPIFSFKKFIIFRIFPENVVKHVYFVRSNKKYMFRHIFRGNSEND